MAEEKKSTGNNLHVNTGGDDLPPFQIGIRTDKTMKFHVGAMEDFPKNTTPLPADGSELTAWDDGWCHYNNDGSTFVLMIKNGFQVYDSETLKVLHTNDSLLGGERIMFSPNGSFVVTWERKCKDQQLKIWRVASGECVLKMHAKDLEEEQWPPVSWTQDEKYLCHLVKNQVNIYDGLEPEQITDRIRADGLFTFKLADCCEPYRIACFVKSRKGQPAKVTVHEWPNLEHVLATKSFFKASACNIVWNPQGTVCLIRTSTDVDKTGASYYGESGLHLLHADGNFQCTVPFLGNKGAVHDAKWSPEGKDFIVVQGFQPAKTTLFRASDCAAVRDFGTGARNTVIFSPHGRFVCIAGFGNLAGEMDFWEKNKFKKIGTCQDPNGAKSFEWTADSRHFITAVLRPKRRVDNGYKIWTYNGQLVVDEKVEQLYQLSIRPSLPNIFPNRPMSPRLTDKRMQKKLQAEQAAAQPKAYIPPHLRGKAGSKPSDIMRREASGPRKLTTLNSAVNTAYSAPSGPVGSAQVGAAPGGLAMTKNQSKNAKRRERAKAKKEEEARKVEAEKAAKLAATKKAAADKLANCSADELAAKKAKKINKQLKQIAKLEALVADGTALDPAQQKKLDTKPTLVEQLAALGL